MTAPPRMPPPTVVAVLAVAVATAVRVAGRAVPAAVVTAGAVAIAVRVAGRAVPAAVVTAVAAAGPAGPAVTAAAAEVPAVVAGGPGRWVGRHRPRRPGGSGARPDSGRTGPGVGTARPDARGGR